MTDEEKDVWVLRVQALGNMGIATVLALMLAFNSYVEAGSRREGMDELNKHYAAANGYLETRNELFREMVKARERDEQQMERLILVLESK